MEFRSLKYTDVGKEILGSKLDLDWIKSTGFFLANFAELQFADWGNKDICGFAICGLIITNWRICDLRTGTPKTIADMRLRNEPKNFRICDLRTNNKNLRVHL
jgi:hypothetical protein